jgi:hypothetical protein
MVSPMGFFIARPNKNPRVEWSIPPVSQRPVLNDNTKIGLFLIPTKFIFKRFIWLFENIVLSLVYQIRVMLVYEFPELNRIRSILSNTPRIQYGGCGFVALAIYDCLVENGHTDISIVFAYLIHYWGEKNHNRILDVNFDEDLIYAPSHVMVRVGEHFIDHNNELTIEQFSFYHSVTREVLIKILKQKNKWNDSFNRKFHVPLIEASIGKKFW